MKRLCDQQSLLPSVASRYRSSSCRVDVRLKTLSALPRSGGQPQCPRPVMRICAKPEPIDRQIAAKFQTKFTAAVGAGDDAAQRSHLILLRKAQLPCHSRPKKSSAGNTISCRSWFASKDSSPMVASVRHQYRCQHANARRSFFTSTF